MHLEPKNDHFGAPFGGSGPRDNFFVIIYILFMNIQLSSCFHPATVPIGRQRLLFSWSVGFCLSASGYDFDAFFVDFGLQLGTLGHNRCTRNLKMTTSGPHWRVRAPGTDF